MDAEGRFERNALTATHEAARYLRDGTLTPQQAFLCAYYVQEYADWWEEQEGLQSLVQWRFWWDVAEQWRNVGKGLEMNEVFKCLR